MKHKTSIFSHRKRVAAPQSLAETLNVIGATQHIPDFLRIHANTHTKELLGEISKIKSYRFPAPMGGEEGFLERFYHASHRTGELLLRDGDPATVNWKARRSDAFAFFGRAIETTMSPLVRILESAITDSEAKTKFREQLNTLVNITTQTCLLIIAANDVTDNYRSQRVAEVFCNIPDEVSVESIPEINETSTTIYKVLAKVNTDRYKTELGTFQELYKVTIESWIAAIGELKSLLKFDDHSKNEKIQSVITAFKTLMQSNLDCLTVNTGNRNLDSNVFNAVQLVECFEAIELVFLESALIEFSEYIPDTVKTILTDEKILEKNHDLIAATNQFFNASNAHATLKGEMERGDATSSILGSVEKRLNNTLQTRKTSFFDYVHKLIEGNEKLNEFTLPMVKVPRLDPTGREITHTAKDAESFFDLLTILRQVEEELFMLNYTFKELVISKSAEPEDYQLTYSDYITKLKEEFQSTELVGKLNGRYTPYQGNLERLTKQKEQLITVVKLILEDVQADELRNAALKEKYEEAQHTVHEATEALKECGDITQITEEQIQLTEDITIPNPFACNLEAFLDIYWLYMLSKMSQEGSY